MKKADLKSAEMAVEESSNENRFDSSIFNTFDEMSQKERKKVLAIEKAKLDKMNDFGEGEIVIKGEEMTAEQGYNGSKLYEIRQLCKFKKIVNYSIKKNYSIDVLGIGNISYKDLENY